MAFSLGRFSLSPSLAVSSSNNQQLAMQQHVSAPSQDYMVMYHEKMKEIRRILANTITRSQLESLILVDKLQHLAIDYHFKDEIHYILSSHYKSLTNGGGATVSSFEVSLGFQLLRQNGYLVSTDVFQRLTDSKGGFIEELKYDLGGVMGLYQASQFGIEEEGILDQVSAFTKANLVGVLPHLNQDQASVESVNLDHLYHKTLTRFSLKHYIKTNENGHEMYNNLLHQFAKLDFNLVQSLHQSELQQFSSWWRDLGLAQKLNFARDQPIKWYMWSLAALEDPRLSEERIQLTKPISLIYLMDDIFDVYGTLDELILFTEAINKWEVKESLPYPMKLFLNALNDITDEFSYEILRKHGWNPKTSLKTAWVRLCNAFLVEAKWFASGQLPTSEEYLNNGVISSGVHVVFVHIFFLLGEGISKESVDLLDKVPSLVSNSATILRLWDDLGSAKDENQNGYDGSYIDCYLKDHKEATLESAREHVISLISVAWKKLNKEYLTPTLFPLSFKKTSLNVAKMVSLMYNYDTNQQLPSLEKQIKSLLYESIPLQ
ncbi:hypothetical protein ACHQM5_003801 [Ranunculus cassubicifolius]